MHNTNEEYKKLCVEMAKRNIKLIKENKELTNEVLHLTALVNMPENELRSTALRILDRVYEKNDIINKLKEKVKQYEKLKIWTGNKQQLIQRNDELEKKLKNIKIWYKSNERKQGLIPGWLKKDILGDNND